MGRITGQLLLQFIAVAAYGLVLPIVCLLIGMLFRRHAAEALARAGPRS